MFNRGLKYNVQNEMYVIYLQKVNSFIKYKGHSFSFGICNFVDTSLLLDS